MSLAAQGHLRGPAGAHAKEWLHFCVDGPDHHVLANLSWHQEPGGVVGRTILLVRGPSGWVGHLEQGPASTPRAGLLRARLGASTVRWVGDRWELDLRAGGLRVHGRVRAELPATPPATSHVGGGSMSWTCMPRGRADVHLELPGERVALRGLAYHDHNWGRFRWGADLGWTWGYALGDEVTAVFLQMSDRAGHRVRRQRLLVWHAGALRVLGDADLEVEARGALLPPRVLHLPPAAGLLAAGRATGVPESLHVRGPDLELVFRARDQARVVLPDEDRALGASFLNEVFCEVELRTPRHTASARGLLELVRA